MMTIIDFYRSTATLHTLRPAAGENIPNNLDFMFRVITKGCLLTATKFHTLWHLWD